MSQNVGLNNNKVYRVVLTGGPCGGKTTGQARLSSFFENLGWKVYRVPETATLLLGGGIKFADLSSDEVFKFQENLMKTMMQIESTFFDLGDQCQKNCLIICDRGTMDATAYLPQACWDRMRRENNWNNVELRDNRYNEVIHMTTAAKGAEAFYQLANNNTRSEGLSLARDLDDKVAEAWVGHPYYDVIDNSLDFDKKLMKMMQTVCDRLDIPTGDRLHTDSKKRKFLIRCLPPDMEVFKCGVSPEDGVESHDKKFPKFQDFVVIHDYLTTPGKASQARIRRRGQNVRWDGQFKQWDLSSGHWSYTHTIRRSEIESQKVDLKMLISKREYYNHLLLAQKEKYHQTIFKTRRCFLWEDQYFQMDIFQEQSHPRCHGLILLETYTTKIGDELKLPDFLEVAKEVTDDPAFSMYNLSLKADWSEALQKECGCSGRKMTAPSRRSLVNGELTNAS